MKIKQLFLMLAIVVISSSNLFAQGEAISFCDKVEIIDADLEDKLNLFTEYEGFQQASISKEGTDKYILEIIYKPNKVTKVERKSFTQVELDAFCSKIIISKDLEKRMSINQDGRRELLISSTVSGLGFYGTVLPLALGIDDDRGVIASYLLIGGGSFFVPFLATRNKEVTKPMARAYSIGTGSGIGHGFLVAGLVATNSNDFESGLLLIPVAMGLGESIGFMAVTKKYDLSLPNVNMIASGSVWGAGWGGSLGLIGSNGNDNGSIALSSTLIGSVAGMYLGHKVYNRTVDMTDGDVTVMNSYGTLGLLTGATLADLALDIGDDNGGKIFLGSITAASIGGMAYGLYRTKNFNYTAAEGAYIGLSEIAGGLVGLGVGFLIDSDFSSETIFVSSAVGATAGLLLVDNYIRKRSLKMNTSIGNLDFGFNPMGVSAAFEEENTVRDLEYYQRSTNNYIVRAGLTF
jgi:hypothetical protein